VIVAAILAFLLRLASWQDQPADEPFPPPAVVTAPAPRPVGTVGEYPTTPHYPPPAPALLDPEHPELQPQLPEETIGRQLDCPAGTVGTVDAAGFLDC